MEKSTELPYNKEKVQSALGQMLKDKDVARHGELKENEDGWTFTFSQFGTTVVDVKVQALDDNNSKVNVNFDIAPTHKIVLTEAAVNTNFDKYKSQLQEKYLN